MHPPACWETISARKGGTPGEEHGQNALTLDSLLHVKFTL